MTGTLHIVGLGPGSPDLRTPAAARAVREADVVVGYRAYLALCHDLLHGKQTVEGTMGEEAARADEALDRAAAGARVALVSSGDAGVYGMAARTLARAAALPAAERPQVVVVPGVTAALAAGALLGAPLADDFATLSLSDLHTPWETVERRLRLVAEAGLALALYNPRSKARTWQLDRVLELLRDARGGETPVALATDVARENEHVELTTLAEVQPERVTMRTVLIVAGDTGTFAGNWLIATRGLNEKVPDPFSCTRDTQAESGSRTHEKGSGPVTCVTLVGAGPGDPKLLTEAAREALAAADVVVYDRPSADAIVALAPPDAERVCVGLQPGRRALSQEACNELLVELGRTGKRVVRLKSGDPFVASRGGEEARALQDAGVAVAVVPGVTSAIGAPAAAGIPLMVRQLSVTCTIVDGNDDPEHGTPPDWETLAKLGGTLVILTGRGRIRRTAAQLIAGGLSPDTPVAAISAGSRPEQRVERGTLAELPPPLKPPVTFVVGAVAALDLTKELDLAHP